MRVDHLSCIGNAFKLRSLWRKGLVCSNFGWRFTTCFRCHEMRCKGVDH